jgi:hypothetical protein
MEFCSLHFHLPSERAGLYAAGVTRAQPQVKPGATPFM